MFARLDLTAVNSEQNVDRFYDIRIETNLFGEYRFQIVYGRNGFKGKTLNYYFNDPLPLSRKLKQTLHKRFHASTRIGTNYYLTKIDHDKMFEEMILTKGILPYVAQ